MVEVNEHDHFRSVPVPRTGCGRFFRWCGCGCAGITAVFVVVMSVIAITFDSWDAAGMRRALRAAMEQAELSPGEQAEMDRDLERIHAACRERDRSAQALEVMLAQVGESPVIPLLMIHAAGLRLVPASGLSPEEKTRGLLDIERLGWGGVDGLIGISALDRVTPHVISGPVTADPKLKPALSDREMRAFLAVVREEADRAGVPDDHFTVDHPAELRKVVDAILSGKGPSVPAAGRAPRPPGDEAE
ncbi:MAG: hypothetical protein ABIF71_10580 [Planctomycetota bacterium]